MTGMSCWGPRVRETSVRRWLLSVRTLGYKPNPTHTAELHSRNCILRGVAPPRVRMTDGAASPSRQSKGDQRNQGHHQQQGGLGGGYCR
jgi:hypothetical protein